MTLTEEQKLANATMLNNLEWNREELPPVNRLRFEDMFLWDRFKSQRPMTEPDWTAPDFHNSPLKSISAVLDAWTPQKSEAYTAEFLEIWDRYHAWLLRSEMEEALQAEAISATEWQWAEIGTDIVTGETGRLTSAALMARVTGKISAQAQEVAEFFDLYNCLSLQDKEIVEFMASRIPKINAERDARTTMR